MEFKDLETYLNRIKEKLTQDVRLQHRREHVHT